MVELIASIYEAAANPELWPGVLKTICERTGAYAANFFSPRLGEGSFVFGTHNVDTAQFAAYDAHFRNVDVWSKAVDAICAYDGRFIRDDDLCDRRTFLTSEYYQDFMRHQGLHSCRAAVIADSVNGQKRRTHFTLYGGPHRNFSAEDDRTIAAILPHVLRALRLYWAQSDWTNTQAQFVQIFDALPYAAFVVDAGLRIRLLNKAAEIEARTAAVYTIRHGQLAIADHDAERQIQAAIHQVTSGTIEVVAPVFVPAKGPQDIHVVCDISPLPRANFAGYALLLLKSPAASNTARWDSVRRRYRLTGAEFEVAKLLWNGLDIQAVAHARAVTNETIRVQVKSVLAKTETATQAELQRLMTALLC